MNNDPSGIGSSSASNYYPTGTYSYMVDYVSNNFLGDPTLRLDPVVPPRNVRVQRIGGATALEWEPSTDPGVVGYLIYRASSRLGPYECLNPGAPVAGQTFPDATAPFGELFYQVRALKTITHPAATYPVTSQGAFGWLKSDGVSSNHAPTSADATRNAVSNALTPIVLPASDEDGDTLFPIITKNLSHGRVVINAGQVIYIPNQDFQGTDSLEFIISDGIETSTPHTLTVNVSGAPLLAWEFQEPAANVPQSRACTSNAAGIAPATITLGPFPQLTQRAVEAYLQEDGLGFIGQAQGQRNATCYLEWTVAPQNGATFSLSSLGFGLWSQPQAIFNAELRWSDDGFATATPVSLGNTTTASISLTGSKPFAGIPFAADLSSVAALQNRTAPVTFRLYIWYDSNRGNGGIGKLGTNFNDLVITGAVSPSSGYASWKDTVNWAGADSAEDADPDGDKISNKLEFLMGKNPLAPDTTYLASEKVEESGKNYLSVDFTRRISDRTLLTAQASADLLSWSNISPDGDTLVEQILNEDTYGDGLFETVKYKLLLPEGTSRRFLRLCAP